MVRSEGALDDDLDPRRDEGPPPKESGNAGSNAIERQEGEAGHENASGLPATQEEDIGGEEEPDDVRFLTLSNKMRSRLTVSRSLRC